MSMTEVVPKQKVSLSLDADIVAEFERGGPLSTQINEALRAAFERRRHQAALGKLVERLKAEFDGLDTEEDRAAIAQYREMLR